MLLLIHCGYGLGQSPLIRRDRNHALKDRHSQREPLIMSAIREAPGAQEEAQETRQKSREAEFRPGKFTLVRDGNDNGESYGNSPLSNRLVIEPCPHSPPAWR